jgi:hypothetical protein
MYYIINILSHIHKRDRSSSYGYDAQRFRFIYFFFLARSCRAVTGLLLDKKLQIGPHHLCNKKTDKFLSL